LYDLFKQYRVFIFYIPLTIYWIVLAVATSLPSKSIPDIFNVGDKSIHLVAYFILSSLVAFSFHFQRKYRHISANYVLVSILTVSLYGLIDELHQLFIPGRYFDMLDWVFNVIGTLLGVTFSYYIIRRSSRMLSNA
jgi:VanZ family protein